MNFNRFRLLVTILAAFAAFFAYLCRLNLSLTIEMMCVQDDSLNVGPDGGLSDDLEELARSLPNMNNEDQTAAIASAWWLRKLSGTKRQRTKSGSSVVVGNKTIQQMRESSIRSLSVFNTNPAGISVNRNGNGPTSGTSPTTNERDSVTQEPIRPQELLNWTEKQRNKLLGAFFLGYVIFQIPLGRAAEIFGPKLMFLWLAVGTGLSSLIFPLAASSVDGIWLAYLVRFVIGASQAALFPAVYVLLCRWLPKKERSSWLAVPSAMGRIGTIVMNLIVPFILKSYGWQMVYYVSGCVVLLWGCLFLLFASDSPQTSHWISDRELMYIEARMEKKLAPGMLVGDDVLMSSTITPSKSKPDSINWLKLIKSKPLWILTLVMFTSEWSNMLLLVKLPGFLGPALRMEVDEIGLWSSVLVGIYCIQYPLSGVLAIKLEAAELDGVDSLRVRKLFEATAHILQALGCLMIAFTSNKTIVLTALFIMMLGRSTVGGGQCLMPPELSKDYPGTVMAVANTMANTAGVVGPDIVTWLVTNTKEYDDWRSLWILSAGVFTCGGLVFCLLADNAPQNYCKKPKGRPPGQMFPPPLGRNEIVSINPGGGGGGGVRQIRAKTAPTKKGEDDNGGDDDKKGQLVDEQVARMDAFSRLASEPLPPHQLANWPSATPTTS